MIKEKFLLLGISSFAGASMADYLIKQKKNVFGTYRNTKIKPYLPFKYNENKENKVKLIKVDLLKDSKKILRIVKKIKPDYYFVLPWHFKKFIIEKEKKLINNGTKFIFPLPRLRIY